MKYPALLLSSLVPFDLDDGSARARAPPREHRTERSPPARAIGEGGRIRPGVLDPHRQAGFPSEGTVGKERYSGRKANPDPHRQQPKHRHGSPKSEDQRCCQGKNNDTRNVESRDIHPNRPAALRAELRPDRRQPLVRPLEVLSCDMAGDEEIVVYEYVHDPQQCDSRTPAIATPATTCSLSTASWNLSVDNANPNPAKAASNHVDASDR